MFIHQVFINKNERIHVLLVIIFSNHSINLFSFRVFNFVKSKFFKISTTTS